MKDWEAVAAFALGLPDTVADVHYRVRAMVERARDQAAAREASKPRKA